MARTAKRAKADAMGKPTILTVDDDPQVSAAIARDLVKQYGSDYLIVRASLGDKGLEILIKLVMLYEMVFFYVLN